GRVALAELGKASQNGPQVRSNVRQDVPVPVPPFWGPRVVTGIRLKDVVSSLDRNALYRLQWGAKNAKGAAWDQLKAEFDPRVRDLVREAERDGWLEPKLVYGFFPVQSDGHDLIVYDPASVRTKNQEPRTSAGTGGSQFSVLGSPQELTRFVFPRQP